MEALHLPTPENTWTFLGLWGVLTCSEGVGVGGGIPRGSVEHVGQTFGTKTGRNH